MKAELLIASGQKPEEVWTELMSAQQLEVGESFRQFCMRTRVKLVQFFESVVQEDITVEGIIDAMVKFLVLQGLVKPLRAFLLEHGIVELTMKKFQELGLAYQQAHGVASDKSTRSPISCSTGAMYNALSSSATGDEACNAAARDSEPVYPGVWRITVEETIRKLERMQSERRRPFVQASRLCYNCLKAGHQAGQCRANKKCEQCGRRHHTLLHQQEVNAVQHDKVLETKKVNMAAACLRNRANGQQIMLMTAVAAVRGESGKEKRTRVFLIQELRHPSYRRGWQQK